jgi:hypothetical protein
VNTLLVSKKYITISQVFLAYLSKIMTLMTMIVIIDDNFGKGSAPTFLLWAKFSQGKCIFIFVELIKD